MENLLKVRKLLIKLYGRNERNVLLCFKLVIGMFVFNIISNMGYGHPRLSMLQSPMITLILSICFAFTPPAAYYPLIMLMVSLQMSVVPPFAILAFLFLLCIYIFYIRLAPKESVLIIAVMLGYYFNVPYAITIMAGLYMSATSIIPIIIGTFLYNAAPRVIEFLSAVSEYSSIAEAAKNFGEIFTAFSEIAGGNVEWIAVAFVHLLVFYAVFTVSKLSLNYAKELSLLSGMGANVLAFVVVMLITGTKFNFFLFLISTVLSFGIAAAAVFFDVLVDYDKAYKVQFEDSENVYYVRVIPKVLDGIYNSPNKFKKAR